MTLAGGAADPSGSQDQAPEGEDSSADAGQAPENPGAGKHRRSDHSVPARTQQYGTCSNYTQLDGQVDPAAPTTPTGDIAALDRGSDGGPARPPKLSRPPCPQGISPLVAKLRLP